MQWRSGLSEKADAFEALKDCVQQIGPAGGPPDVAFVFPSPHHGRHYGRIPDALHDALHPKALLGCSGGGVIGSGREVERRPGLAVLAGWLPDVRVQLFRLEPEKMPGPDAPPRAWRDWLGLKEAVKSPSFVLLADPFSADVEELAQGLDFSFPGSVKVGGLASAAAQPGGNALYLDEKVFSSGAVVAMFEGNITIDPLVAQGCRPIGKPLKVTKCEKNFLMEVDGSPILDHLERMLESLNEEDQGLARTSLFLGVLNTSMKTGDAEPDFLIRNLVGLDPERGILAVGAYLRPGQTVQFHLRDRNTSHQDLKSRLSKYRRPTQPTGALLFSCLGRGQGLYGKPNHDSELFAKSVGPLAVGGFFCNGEIGPVEGSTYLHGYTSCFGIFRPAK